MARVIYHGHTMFSVQPVCLHMKVGTSDPDKGPSQHTATARTALYTLDVRSQKQKLEHKKKGLLCWTFAYASSSTYKDSDNYMQRRVHIVKESFLEVQNKYLSLIKSRLNSRQLNNKLIRHTVEWRQNGGTVQQRHILDVFVSLMCQYSIPILDRMPVHRARTCAHTHTITQTGQI